MTLIPVCRTHSGAEGAVWLAFQALHVQTWSPNATHAPTATARRRGQHARPLPGHSAACCFLVLHGARTRSGASIAFITRFYR